MTTETEARHRQIVHALFKRESAVPPLVHAVLGISGEAGELLDAIKKHCVYNKYLDVINCVEELGDLEFYLEALRQELGVTRETCLSANIMKLEKRYPLGTYTDQHAQARLDKEQAA